MPDRLIVMVCTGNLCRSPMAEYLLRRRLPPDSVWSVASAGTSAAAGLPASEGAQRAMAEIGTDLRRHRSQPLTDLLVQEADVLLTMTAEQRDSVLLRFPEAAGRVYLLKGLGTDPYPGNIDDPIGMNLDAYRRVRDDIDSLMPDVILFLHERGRR